MRPKERITIAIVRSESVKLKHENKYFNVLTEQTCEECNYHFVIDKEDLTLESDNHETAFVDCLECENEHVVFLFDA